MVFVVVVVFRFSIPCLKSYSVFLYFLVVVRFFLNRFFLYNFFRCIVLVVVVVVVTRCKQCNHDVDNVKMAEKYMYKSFYKFMFVLSWLYAYQEEDNLRRLHSFLTCYSLGVLLQDFHSLIKFIVYPST